MQMDRNSTVFVTFGTPEFSQARARHRRTLRRFGFRNVLSYGRDSAPVVQARNENPEIFAHARGYGFWLWKPYIIEAALDAAAPGALVVYTDIAVAMVAAPWRLLDHARKRDVTLFGVAHRQRQYTKRDAFVLAGADAPIYWNSGMANAAFIIVRNGTAGRRFVAEWKALIRDPRVLTDQPNTQGLPNFPDFVDHRHDQSVLSILAIRENIPLLPDPSQWGREAREAAARRGEQLPDDFGEIFDHHRRRNRSLWQRMRGT
jgi:hypothetical protein